MQMPLIGLSGVLRHRQLYKMAEAASRLDFGGSNLVHLIFTKSADASPRGHVTIPPRLGSVNRVDINAIKMKTSPVTSAERLRLTSPPQVSSTDG